MAEYYQPPRPEPTSFSVRMDVTIYWGKTGHLTASGDRDFVLSFILTPEEQILLAERRKGNE